MLIKVLSLCVWLEARCPALLPLWALVWRAAWDRVEAGRNEPR